MTAGALRLHNAGLTALDFFDEASELYGIDEGLSLSTEESDQEGVAVPPNEFSLTNEQLTELQSSVNPLSHSDNMGIDLYVQGIHCIESMFVASDFILQNVLLSDCILMYT